MGLPFNELSDDVLDFAFSNIVTFLNDIVGDDIFSLDKIEVLKKFAIDSELLFEEDGRIIGFEDIKE